MVVEEALLREYEKVADLFMSESRTAWELLSIYMIVQVGLVSAIVVLLSEGVSVTPFGYPILFPAGSLFSFAWFFMFYRNKMWRDNWFLLGLRTERQLRDRGIVLDIFQTEHLGREKLALELFDEEIRYRNQRWHEKIGGLRVAHYAMFAVGVVWFMLFLYFLIE